MNPRITTRWLLILALTATQFVCLKVGEMWFTGAMVRRLRAEVRAASLERSAMLAHGVSEILANGEEVDYLKPVSDDINSVATRAADVLMRTQLSNDAWLAVVGARWGRLLAVSGNSFLTSAVGDWPEDLSIESMMGICDITDIESAPGGLVTGKAQIAGQDVLLAANCVPELGVVVIAGQTASAVELQGADVALIIHRVAVNIGLLMTAMGGLLAASIVLRYENKLSGINRDLRTMVRRRSRSLVRARDAVIFGLAKLAESRDDDTGEHLERIREYVSILARELARSHPEIDEEYIQRLEVTSSLHDVGKVGIPDSVLLKPGRLTSAEHDVIKTHTIIGGDCLLAIRDRMDDDGFLETACEIALAHHERWDGRGYPFGLKGAEIPLTARIVALADVYDALTTERVYKPALTHDAARDIIIQGAGTQFDPEIVDAFLRRQMEFQQTFQRRAKRPARRRPETAAAQMHRPTFSPALQGTRRDNP